VLFWADPKHSVEMGLCERVCNVFDSLPIPLPSLRPLSRGWSIFERVVLKRRFTACEHKLMGVEQCRPGLRVACRRPNDTACLSCQDTTVYDKWDFQMSWLYNGVLATSPATAKNGLSASGCFWLAAGSANGIGADAWTLALNMSFCVASLGRDYLPHAALAVARCHDVAIVTADYDHPRDARLPPHFG